MFRRPESRLVPLVAMFALAISACASRPTPPPSTPGEPPSGSAEPQKPRKPAKPTRPAEPGSGTATSGPSSEPETAERPPWPSEFAAALDPIGAAAENRLASRFSAAGVPYPPAHADLLAFKEERRIELWAPVSSRPRRVAVYPLTDTSGTLGPKLAEGDYQIPEGIYRVVLLNPASAYHLSMKLDYPNAFDRARARDDGRTDLGGEIFVHGSDVTIGCLPVGDPAIEELFVLAVRIGKENVRAIVAPRDLRRRPPPPSRPEQPDWVPLLYRHLANALARFR